LRRSKWLQLRPNGLFWGGVLGGGDWSSGMVGVAAVGCCISHCWLDPCAVAAADFFWCCCGYAVLAVTCKMLCHSLVLMCGCGPLVVSCIPMAVACVTMSHVFDAICTVWSGAAWGVVAAFRQLVTSNSVILCAARVRGVLVFLGLSVHALQ
jgi:hypothetical protein